jgi:hypothetical protein
MVGFAMPEPVGYKCSGRKPQKASDKSEEHEMLGFVLTKAELIVAAKEEQTTLQRRKHRFLSRVSS